MDEMIGFGLYQSCGNMRSVGRVSVSGLRWCVGGEWVRGLGPEHGRTGWCYVCVSCDFRILCVDGQVHISVYCGLQIPAHLRCIQCSILLHLMDICFLPSICL